MNLIKRKLDDSIRVETKETVPLGAWHHVAMTYDGSRMATGVQIYLDGEPQELEIILDAINQDFQTNEPLRVGGGGGAGSASMARFEDVRVYSRERRSRKWRSSLSRKRSDEIAAVEDAYPGGAQAAVGFPGGSRRRRSAAARRREKARRGSSAIISMASRR